MTCQIAVETTKRGRDDIRTVGGEGGQHVRSCGCKMRAGMTYSLEVEREGDVSDRHCDL
jgi:hypothetical protein